MSVFLPDRMLSTPPHREMISACVALGAGGGAIGARRSFEKKMSIPSGGIGPAVQALGVIGYIAKGIALAIVGILLLVATVTVDPTAAGGLDAAMGALLALPSGPWLTGAVDVGPITYGAFGLLRGGFARL